MSLEQLMDVRVTTVSREESSVGQSPAAVSVITPEMIRRSGATTFPELFRMVPGMNVARIDNNKWAVGVRGFNTRFQNDLLVQVDGRTLYNPVTSGVYWDTADYPLEDIERIEVVRGPGASVWGANAVNGIINIITKPAKDTQGALITLGGGSAEQGFGTIRYGFKLSDDVFLRVYAKSFTRGDTFSQVGEHNDGWWGASTGFRLDWRAGAQDSITLDGGYFHSDAGRRDSRAKATPPFSFINEESEVSNGEHVLARWTHTIDKDSSWVLQAYWDGISRKSDNIVNWQWDTYDVDFQHNFRWGSRQKIVWGLAYRLQDAELRPSPIDNGFNLDWIKDYRLKNLYSAFFQDEISVVPDRLTLTAGTKVEHNDFTGWEVQPTGRLLWTPTRQQSVWASFSRAVRTPNLSEDQIQFRSPGSLSPAGTPVFPALLGNTGLHSEKVLAYEIGYRTQVTHTLSVDLATFYNDYRDLKVRVAQPASGALIPVVPGNVMAGETYGAELAATWQVTPKWRLYGAYTYLQMQLHLNRGLAVGAGGADGEAREGQSPENQVYLQSSWDLPGNMEFDLIGRFVDRLNGLNPNPRNQTQLTPNVIKDYVSLDARLAWHPNKNCEVALIGQNLLDSHRPEFGPDSVVRGSALVELRRSVYGQVTYRW